MPSCVIVAEAGLNHNGQVDLAFELVEQAKMAGADIVKFQHFTPEKLFRDGDPDATKIAALALSRSDTLRVVRYCAGIDIEFMSTPDDLDSLKFLVEECGVKRIKIGSADLTNMRLLRAAAATGLPMIISTGMATLNEIEDALNESLLMHKGRDVILLHCVSLYPCPLEEANLLAIRTLRQRYNYPIGYSDHTADPLVCALAACLGAALIEAHLRLTLYEPVVDAEVSYTAEAFKEMVWQVDRAIIASGDGRKCPSVKEMAMRDQIRKGADGLRGVI